MASLIQLLESPSPQLPVTTVPPVGGEEGGRLGDVLRLPEVPEGPAHGPLGQPGGGVLAAREPGLARRLGARASRGTDLLLHVSSVAERWVLERGIWNWTISFNWTESGRLEDVIEKRQFIELTIQVT